MIQNAARQKEGHQNEPKLRNFSQFYGNTRGAPNFSKGAPDNARGALRPSTPLWLEHCFSLSGSSGQ